MLLVLNQKLSHFFMHLLDVHVLRFSCKGKEIGMADVGIFDDVTEVFERLSKKPLLVSDDNMELIKAFVVMYDI